MTKRPVNEQELAILEFCKSGKRVEAIANHFKFTKATVYNHLGSLRRRGLLERYGYGAKGCYVIYTTVGSATVQPAPPPPSSSYLQAPILRAHDPFNLAGRNLE